MSPVMIVPAVASPFSADSVCMMSGRKHHRSFRPSAHATRQSSGASSASPRCFCFLMMCRLSSVFFAHCTGHRVCLSSPISQTPAIALIAANLHTLDHLLALAGCFAAQIAANHTKLAPLLDDNVLLALRQNHWPGKARELRNVTQLAVLPGNAPHLGAADLG